MHNVGDVPCLPGKKNAWTNSLLDKKQVGRNSAVIKPFFFFFNSFQFKQGFYFMWIRLNTNCTLFTNSKLLACHNYCCFIVAHRKQDVMPIKFTIDNDSSNFSNDKKHFNQAYICVQGRNHMKVWQIIKACMIQPVKKSSLCILKSLFNYSKWFTWA